MSEAEDRSLVDEIRSVWLEDYERRLRDLYMLEQRLTDMQRHCIFRINGVCWWFCNARDFCRPEENGLVSVAELGKRGKRKGKRGEK